MESIVRSKVSTKANVGCSDFLFMVLPSDVPRSSHILGQQRFSPFIVVGNPAFSSEVSSTPPRLQSPNVKCIITHSGWPWSINSFPTVVISHLDVDRGRPGFPDNNI